MILTSMCLIVIAYLLYKRYIPVCGVKCDGWEKVDFKSKNIIDVRDYNESYKKPIKGAINIPVAYLNRFHKEIPNREIHVIGSSQLEKNVGIRFLRQKGYKVTGYTIIEKNNLCLKEKLCV